MSRELRMQKSEIRMQNSRPGEQMPDVRFNDGL
jgi:hypothetical protein